jgi:arylsulfatase A-like enzyme
LAVLLVVASLGSCDVFARRGPLRPPCADCNVVLISLDTLRADHIGAYGYARPTTPNIDALAAQSVVFEQAVSQSAWTRPAHASMLSGLYPAEHGIVSIARGLALSPTVPTLATTLAEHGYATAAFTGGGNMSAHFGFDNGFEIYRSPGRRLVDSLPEIERWLAVRDERPFFLFVHAFDPHRPYKSEAVDRAALGLGAVRPGIPMPRACRAARAAEDLTAFVDEYDAAIRHGDRALGRLLALLDRTRSRRPTLLVFTSDHGEEFFDHGDCFHIRTLYREIVHVPLIIRLPGTLPRRVRELVPASVSVAPTILELVGASMRPRAGLSLAPLLEGRRRSVTDYVVSETAIRYRNRMVGRVRALTSEREKLIEWVAERRSEYFDLVRDPLERDPLAETRSSDAALARLDAWAAAHPQRPGAAVPRPLPAELKRELRALGYVD